MPFPYAGDGYTVEWLKPGDERDFGAVAAGLASAGLIAAPKAQDPSESETPPVAPESDVEQPKKRGRPSRS